MRDEDEELREERDALRGLPGEIEPPAELEERVVGALRRRGLVRPGSARLPRSPAAPLRLAGALAAGVLLFAAGWAVGSRGSPGDRAPGRYLLLLYEGDEFRAGEADVPRLVAEYADWAADLRREGRLAGAEKLADDGRLLAADAGGVRTEAAVPAAAEGRISGFFLIRARDWAEAVEIAARAPHLRYGGRISVRRIEPT